MKTNKPLLSIVTVCWNSGATIERTIKSVFQQKFDDFEYIIVDGGSTDGTIEIIKRYEPLFAGRLFWKSEPDKGIYDAFNKGIKRSNGEYVWIVNSDDWIEPDALSNIVKGIESIEKKNSVLAFSLNLVNKYGKVLSVCNPPVNEDSLKVAYQRDYIGIPHPATIVAKSIYTQYGDYDTQYKIIGDMDWFHRVYAHSVPFYFFPVVITNMSNCGVSNMFSFRKSSKDRILYLKKNYKSGYARVIHYMYWLRSFYSQKLKSWRK